MLRYQPINLQIIITTNNKQKQQQQQQTNKQTELVPIWRKGPEVLNFFMLNSSENENLRCL